MNTFIDATAFIVEHVVSAFTWLLNVIWTIIGGAVMLLTAAFIYYSIWKIAQFMFNLIF